MPLEVQNMTMTVQPYAVLPCIWKKKLSWESYFAHGWPTHSVNKATCVGGRRAADLGCPSLQFCPSILPAWRSCISLLLYQLIFISSLHCPFKYEENPKGRSQALTQDLGSGGARKARRTGSCKSQEKREAHSVRRRRPQKGAGFHIPISLGLH